MTTSIKMGEEVLCMNDKGIEDTGIRYGAKYVANNVMVIPGQGDFVGVFVESVGQIVVVDADRFEKAYTLHYRIFHDAMTYVLIDDTFDEEDHKDKGENYADITITLPESRLKDVEEVLDGAITQLTMEEKENATSH